MNSMLQDLNEEQVECVSHEAEVLQILAGPGSGKTRVLTVRIALAVSQRLVAPERIIVVTFTNKAARELKQRLAQLIGDALAQRLIVGTFHSVALRYLQRYGTNIGLDKKIKVSDTLESRSVVAKVLKELRKARQADAQDNQNDAQQITASACLGHISTLKSNGISVSCFQNTLNAKTLPISLSQGNRIIVSTVYTQYQEYLSKHNLLDFDDLILKGIDLLTTCPRLVGNIEQVFVDEFQDTSRQQYELMRLFAQQRHQLTIVGDHDQSIYGFRAADIENFRRMHTTYNNCVVYHLKQNYRSTGAIVFAASAIIEQDSARPMKRLETGNVLGSQPTLRILKTAKNEADWLAKEVLRLVSGTCGILNMGDFAVLVRSASLTLPIEQALQRNKINYRLSNARKFLERPHIRILVNYLRTIHDDSSLALLEVINIPSRKFGQVSIDSLLLNSSKYHKSLWWTLKAVAKGTVLLSKKRDNSMERRLSQFVRTIEHCKQCVKDDMHYSMNILLTSIIEEINFSGYLKEHYPEDYLERLEDVQEFLQTSDILAENEMDAPLPEVAGHDIVDHQESTLDRLLSALALMSDSNDKKEASTPSLVISTIHSAKGLEWPVVFVPGVYHGSIPSARAMDTEQDEERRLLYVAMTRAKSLLYLSYSERNARHESVMLSSFLSHHDIVPFLDSRGPKLTIHVMKEIASVLCRPLPSLESFRISEDSYEDKSSEQLADEARDILNRDMSFQHKVKAVPLEAEKGFSTARMVLQSLPSNKLHNLSEPDHRKPQVQLKRGQSDIKAFFAPSGPTTISSNVRSIREAKIPDLAVVDDHRVVLLSSSPDREHVSLQRKAIPLVPQNLNMRKRLSENASPTHVHTEMPVQRKRLGMSRPRIPK